MLMDERNEFADGLALDIAGGTGLALVGDVIDLEQARNIGNANRLFLVIEITVDVDSAGDGTTVAFVLASDAGAAIAADGTASEHLRTPAFAQAALVAGFKVILPLPPQGSVPYEQFLGILQDTGVEALTAGSFNAFLTTAAPQWDALPDAVPD